MRTSYHLGLGQPYLLTEVSLEDHPLSPFAVRDQVRELSTREVVEVVQVRPQPVQVVAAEAAVEAAAEL